MKIRIKRIFKFTTKKAKMILSYKYGNDFSLDFIKIANKHFENIIKDIPNIGDSAFKISYYMCPCYIAWYKTLLDMNISEKDANLLIWDINETLLKSYPQIIVKFIAKKVFIGKFRKAALDAERKAIKEELHEMDWKIRGVKLEKNIISFEIYECAIVKMCKNFNVEGLLPYLCRMDYLFAHYIGIGFNRTKTLGDGDDYCNCKYIFSESCEWAPEKGFEYRK
ncbi:L-2-amino-thiazoline-4-carboxylic acid hydrolase [Clostridium ihumii]|uniref:L-2-amino-thiazoline-4-carboxylic acid hydrolase n=1 Tax=Clostridium ihumii TaxID=1470356 RepID=UPI00058B646D|nr:L-2-amino-thiazoline-4-carboxylic acid hydrolase [Clostridium ihumii]